MVRLWGPKRDRENHVYDDIDYRPETGDDAIKFKIVYVNETGNDRNADAAHSIYYLRFSSSPPMKNGIGDNEQAIHVSKSVLDNPALLRRAMLKVYKGTAHRRGIWDDKEAYIISNKGRAL